MAPLNLLKGLLKTTNMATKIPIIIIPTIPILITFLLTFFSH